MELIPEVKNSIEAMFCCRSFEESLACFHHFYNELEDWIFVIFSDDATNKLPDVLCTNYENDFAVINIGSSNGFYAVNRDIYWKICTEGTVDYNVDICIDLDTQAVSYLKNMFKEYGKRPDFDKHENLISFLNLPEVEYSCMPYLIENGIKGNEIDKIECYNNIKSFMLFKNFKFKSFSQNNKVEYNKAKEEIILDTDRLYHDIFSDKFVVAYRDIHELQKFVYALLLKAICIEFINSKRSAQNKMRDLFDFVNNELGIVLERELEICYFYFQHKDLVRKFFRRVQKNAKDLLPAVSGMAWDLVHVRWLEQQFGYIPNDKVIFAFHALLTYDTGLKEILKINPIEQIAMYRGVSLVKFSHSFIDDIAMARETLMADEKVEHRHQIFAQLSIEELCCKIESELQLLCTV